jgi:sarcosine oxidase subunit gamma
MADGKVLSRSALAGLASPRHLGAVAPTAGVCIREIASFAAIGVNTRRGRSGEVCAILSRHAGSPVQDAAGRVGSANLAITGTAPGQWLVMSRGPDARKWLDSVCADLNGIAAVTDQGDGRVVLEVLGSRARDTLAKGIPVDLDATAFKVGDAAQTTASHIGLQIALIDNAPTFEIISARSTAESLWSWLVASAAEYGIDVL